MFEQEAYDIKSYIDELKHFSASDLLVHVSDTSTAVLPLDPHQDLHSIPFSTKWNQVYKVALQYKKRSDIQTLCISKGLLKWFWKDREIHTPLFLHPVHVKLNKAIQQVAIQVDETHFFLNPFVLQRLQMEFEVEFGVEHSRESTRENLFKLLQELKLKYAFSETSYVANFHYHRFEILRDLEEIQERGESYTLNNAFGLSDQQNVPLHLHATHLFPADVDQRRIINRFQNENLVVQGPPGTGKSHLLSNILAKALVSNYKAALVSEKKTALEVVYQKLASIGLEKYTLLVGNQHESAVLLKRIKETWLFLESYHVPSSRFLYLSAQYDAQLQLLVDKLTQQSLLKEFSLSYLQRLSKERKNAIVVPQYKTWVEHEKTVELLVENGFQNHILKLWNPKVFHQERFLQESLDSLQKLIAELKQFVLFQNVNELRTLNKKAIHAQIVANEQALPFVGIYKNETLQAKFHKLQTKFRSQLKKMELLKEEMHIWEHIPTRLELTHWNEKRKNGSWFEKRAVRREIYKRLRTATLPLDEVLLQTEHYLKVQEEKAQLELKALDLGIENIEVQGPVISFVLNEIKKVDHSLNWEELQHSANVLIDQATKIKQSLQLIDDCFHLDPIQPIENQLNELNQHVQDLIPFVQDLKKLPLDLLHCLANFSSIEASKEAIVVSEFQRNVQLFPELNQLDEETVSAKLSKALRQEEEDARLLIQEIHYRQKKAFDEAHRLLQTPSAKLRADEKARKAKLKNGKAILVKEMAKSRQHKSIRELLESDAGDWIQLLQPVVMATASAISTHFPLKEALFDFVLIDEASQMPVAKAIPVFYRSKRFLLTGDEQQMSPSNYFSGAKSSMDALHFATFHAKNDALHHHYRSLHAQLIAFSNRHFYESKLLVFPSYPALNDSLKWHYVENGVYENRQNQAEAEAIARTISHLKSSDKSIGIVAFSEQQLLCIWNAFNPEMKDFLTQKFETGKWFMRSLEQVQGDECDILVISFGYGYDKQNVFNLRFGPLNQQSGTKRLNVLLTRAREQVYFFSSVKSTDFKLSSNEAVNLLRQWFLYLEQAHVEVQTAFPFDLHVTTHENSLSVHPFYQQIGDVQELKTLYAVLQDRGWKLDFQV